MIQINTQTSQAVPVTYLKAECDVRYWEDAEINGVEDVDGTLIPCRVGDTWSPVINLATGTIEDWPSGTTADLHFKVCDAGRYALLNEDREEVIAIDDYVPKIMCPGGMGFGDYVIMKIDETGKIADWHLDLSPFCD